MNDTVLEPDAQAHPPAPAMARLDWSAMDGPARRDALARPPQSLDRRVTNGVRRIIEQVRADGDSTLRALTRRYDQVEIADTTVQPAEFAAAEAALDASLRRVMRAARDRIAEFHAAGRIPDYAVDTAPGVRCERIARGIGRVGLYIPAGSAPLPSTALMLGVPAALAGCGEVIACTPPRRDGRADPAVLHAASLCGIGKVHKVGGAQAIAAMAYGTESIPRCDKIFGPGNAWVTAAKRAVAADPDGAAIDMPAGPSELLVVADGGANPAFVASDLLSQAEHGEDSQVLLVSDSDELLDGVVGELAAQLPRLPRAAIARAALAGSRMLRVPDIDTAITVSNLYAPEHLVLTVREPRRWLPRVRAAGSVFLGDLAPEALGDYCSGTNHVLPTHGAARAFSGVSVASFQTFMTVQAVDAIGLRNIGPDAVTLACAEGLHAHATAVVLRLSSLESV